MFSLEKHLLSFRGVPERDFDSQLKPLAVLFSDSQFIDILNHSTFQDIRSTFQGADWATIYQEFVGAILTFICDQNSAFSALILGAAFLNAFVQDNFTGPSLSEEYDVAFNSITASAEDCIKLLTINEEKPFLKVKHPHFLLLARAILLDCGKSFEKHDVQTIHWWTMRVCSIHLRVLSNPASDLCDTLEAVIHTVIDLFAPHHKSLQMDSLRKDETDSEETVPVDPVEASALLETGLACNSIYKTLLARDCFNAALKSSGLKTELTGALGKRTRWQKDEKSQLVLAAASQLPVKDREQLYADTAALKEVALEDDTLLANVAITAPQPSLSDNIAVLDQCIVLALCLNVKNQNPMHGLTTEEMIPYVSRVLANPNNWLVHSHALLLRARLEKAKQRTADRSALQVQALVDQFEMAAEAPVKERTDFFYTLLFPPLWEMKRELAEMYATLGIVRTALGIFESLEMWEEAIQCHINAYDDKKAKALLLERLEATPEDPNLWCIYGDIERDPQHYEKALAISHNRSSRAYRSLAHLHARQQLWLPAIENFQKALEINPMYPTAWFTLGCAAMAVEDWALGARAFSRVAKQDPEEAEAWANLANCFIRLKDKHAAFNAYREALRYRRNSWKMWENFMFVAVDIGEFVQAMFAMEKLLEIREEKTVDVGVLEILVNAILHDIADANDQPCSKHFDRLKGLLGHITSKITSNPDVWALFARLYTGAPDKVVEYRQKEVRACQRTNWQDDVATIGRLAAACEALTDAVLQLNSPQPLRSTRMLFRGICKRIEERFSDTAEYKNIASFLEQIEEALASA